MTCDGVRDRLHEYVDHELSQFECAQVEAHLRRCPTCAEELRLLRATVALLADLDEADVPASFRPALMARIAAMPAPVIPLPARAARRPRTAPLWQRWGLPSVAVAAVAALVAINIVGPLRDRVLSRIDAPAAGNPAGPVITEPGPDPSVSQTSDVTLPPDPGGGTPDAHPVAEPDEPGLQPDNPEPANDGASGQSGGPPGPGTSAGPNSSDQPPADVPGDGVVAPSETTGASGPGPVVPPAPATQGMTRFRYNLTVQTQDVARTAKWLREWAQHLVKDEQLLPGGAIRVNLEVTEEAAEQWVADLARELGSVTQHPTETESLQAQFDQYKQLLDQTQADLQNALATAEDPGQPEAVRQAARQQAEIFQREIARLEAELDDIEQRDRHASIVLTLEAQR